jgi:signal transduction histidine kinase
MLAIVHEETARLNDVLTRFLAFARPHTGERTTVALAEEIRDVADLVEHRAGAPLVSSTGIDEPGQLRGDRAGLRQVLLNLALNAAAAAGPAPGGRVSFDLRRSDDRLVVTVTDNGPGFTPEAVANLGTPFFTTRHGGTGLGLATSLRIVRDHGGDIMVDEGYTAGARVVLTLPCTEEETR